MTAPHPAHRDWADGPTGVNPALTVNARTRPAPVRTRRVVENDEYAGFVRRIVTAHARRVAHGDPEALRDLLDLETHLRDALTHAVAGLRVAGYSWAEIAARTGTTRQAAHARWGTGTGAGTAHTA